MGSLVTQEFLVTHGFRLKTFSDGYFWVRNYTSGYTLQVNEGLTEFTEDDGGFIEYFDSEEFISLVEAHQRAIEE